MTFPNHFFGLSLEGTGAAVFGGFPPLPHFAPALALGNLSLDQIGTITVFIVLSIPALVGLKTLFFPVRHEIAGQPIEVKSAPHYLTDDDCKQRRNDIERRVTALEQRFAEVDKKWADDMRGLRGDLEKKVDSLHHRITDTTQALDGKISDLPERIVALLTTAKRLNQ